MHTNKFQKEEKQMENNLQFFNYEDELGREADRKAVNNDAT